jgi:hypothetical protein
MPIQPCTICGSLSPCAHDSPRAALPNDTAKLWQDERLSWQNQVEANERTRAVVIEPEKPDRVADALDRLVSHFEKKDQQLEKARAESWQNVRHEPVRVDPTNAPHPQQACIFCSAKSPWVMRGPLILGCVACISAALGDK